MNDPKTVTIRHGRVHRGGFAGLIRTTFPIIALVLTAACSGVVRQDPPTLETPELPPEWTAEDLSGVVETEGAVSWSTLLAQPVLHDLVLEALTSNGSLAAAAARVEQATSRARIVGADRYPEVNAAFNGSRRKQNFIGFPIPGAEDRIFSTTTTTWGAGLNISWEVDLWGRIRAGHRAALADIEAFEADLRGARLSLAALTVKAWLSSIEALQQVDLATETLQNRQLNESRVSRRYREGLAPSIDLRLARTNVALAEAALAARERQLDAGKRQLEILLGRYPAAEIAVVDDLPRLPRTVAAGIPAELISRRPDLVAAERRLVASNARIAQARASLYPQIRLTGSAGSSTDELESLVDGDFSVWSLAFNILQPVFQGGRLRAGVDLQEAIGDEIAASFIQQALNAYGEVELAIVTEATLARQEESLETAVDSATAAQSAAEDRYAAGLADYLLVLETQRQTLDARSRLLELRRQRLTALVDLCLALGGDLGPIPDDEQRESRS